MTEFGDAVVVTGSSGQQFAKVNPGQFFVSTKDIDIVTVLGSCVSACIRDPIMGVGGINHFMLPLGCEDRAESWGGGPGAAGAVNRFGNYAMESLINSVMKAGGNRKRFEIKLFGGGRVLDISADVGKTNVEFVLDYLQAEQLEVAAMDVGQEYARKLIYNPITGRARMKKLREIYNGRVAQTEKSLMETAAVPPPVGSVELF